MVDFYKADRTGEIKELVSSGSLVTFGSGAISQDIQLKDQSITLIFDFVNSGEHRGRDAVPEVSGNALRVIFYNYDNPSGIYSKEPLFLGIVAQRPFWLTYNITGLQKSDSRVVIYSLYTQPSSPTA